MNIERDNDLRGYWVEDKTALAGVSEGDFFSLTTVFNKIFVSDIMIKHLIAHIKRHPGYWELLTYEPKT